MSMADQTYTPARDMRPLEIPASVSAFLNGEDLLSKTQAVRISTTDADGWPRAILLTAGEMLVLPDGSMRFAVFRESGTAANLLRDGRLTLSLSLDRGVCEVRLRATPCNRQVPQGPLAYFRAEADGARMHVVDYADVTSGVTFAVHDPAAVLARWQQQLAALREVS